MITTRDVLFIYNLLQWGGIILLIVAVSFACYQINPKLFNKNPQLIFLPGLVVAGLLYAVGQVEKMQERGKPKRKKPHGANATSRPKPASTNCAKTPARRSTAPRTMWTASCC